MEGIFFFNHMFISHKPKIQYEVNQKQWQQECFGNHINQEVTIISLLYTTRMFW